jgi:hypothetical protein
MREERHEARGDDRIADLAERFERMDPEPQRPFVEDREERGGASRRPVRAQRLEQSGARWRRSRAASPLRARSPWRRPRKPRERQCGREANVGRRVLERVQQHGSPAGSCLEQQRERRVPPAGIVVVGEPRRMRPRPPA